MAARVSFALGSWQLVSLAAGLRDASRDGGRAFDDDTVVLYETGAASAALQRAMRDVAAQAYPWTRIVEAFDVLADVPRRIAGGELARRIDALRARLGSRRVDELWLCWLSRPAERLVLEAFPDARIVFYEDGLTSYLPLAAIAAPQGPLAAVGAAIDARVPALAFRRHKGSIAPRHAERVAEARMLLGDVWPAPEALAHVPWKTVRPDALRATIDACRRIDAVAAFVPPPQRERPRVLVLGQALARFGALPRDAEQQVYAEAIRTIVTRGYDVLWKEHPRAEQPFFDALAAGAPAERLRRLELPFALPVELVADRLGLAACAAGISAALWYLPRLDGTPAHSFADRLAPHLGGRWAMQNDLVLASSTPLSRLPDAAPA